MSKKFMPTVKKTIKEEYKFILALVILYFIFQIPVNYYIVVGGGTDDVSSRIKVEDKNTSKGSFNISYVTQLKGTLLTYGLSYVVPTWERESADNYKYNVKESIDDIEFRSDLYLTDANEKAKYWAYSLANKEVEEKSSKLYIITLFEGMDSTLKVQDQVLSVDDQSFETVDGYRNYLQTKSKNDIVDVKIIRNKKEKVVKAKLHENEGKIVLGVGLMYVTEYNTDPKVDIKFKKDESGSSGGLITTLEIYNQLTSKDLTKGYKIAGTGTIEQDGTIGEIGGIEHKILGAYKDKADYFLVPAGDNYKDAVKYIKKKHLKVNLIKVNNIEDAIAKLEALK